MAIRFPTSPHIPKLFVFDCDYTLWQCWIDTHSSGGPYKYDDKTNTCIDRGGYRIKPYKDINTIWDAILQKGGKIALASRTETPKRANEVLRLLKSTNGKRWYENVVSSQIYPGDKLQHLRTISNETKIPFKDILFFDDESRNRNVESLGVAFCLVDETVGVTIDVFNEAVSAYSAGRSEVNEKEDDSPEKGRPKR